MSHVDVHVNSLFFLYNNSESLTVHPTSGLAPEALGSIDGYTTFCANPGGSFTPGGSSGAPARLVALLAPELDAERAAYSGWWATGLGAGVSRELRRRAQDTRTRDLSTTNVPLMAAHALSASSLLW